MVHISCPLFVNSGQNPSFLSPAFYLVRIFLHSRWLNKLGVAAQHGYKVIIRQSMFKGEYSLLGQDLEPNPVSLLALSPCSHHAFINLWLGSSPSFALSVARDANENREEKMAAWNPGGWGDHFFLAVFVRVKHDVQSKRGTIRSLIKSALTVSFTLQYKLTQAGVLIVSVL